MTVIEAVQTWDRQRTRDELEAFAIAVDEGTLPRDFITTTVLPLVVPEHIPDPATRFDLLVAAVSDLTDWEKGPADWCSRHGFPVWSLAPGDVLRAEVDAALDRMVTA